MISPFTRNVVQMLVALTLLVVIMLSITENTKELVLNRPSGFQNAVEPVITFVRDEVAKPIPDMGKSTNI